MDTLKKLFSGKDKAKEQAALMREEENHEKAAREYLRLADLALCSTSTTRGGASSTTTNSPSRRTRTATRYQDPSEINTAAAGAPDQFDALPDSFTPQGWPGVAGAQTSAPPLERPEVGGDSVTSSSPSLVTQWNAIPGCVHVRCGAASFNLNNEECSLVTTLGLDEQQLVAAFEKNFVDFLLKMESSGDKWKREVPRNMLRFLILRTFPPLQGDSSYYSEEITERLLLSLQLLLLVAGTTGSNYHALRETGLHRSLGNTLRYVSNYFYQGLSSSTAGAAYQSSTSPSASGPYVAAASLASSTSDEPHPRSATPDSIPRSRSRSASEEGGTRSNTPNTTGGAKPSTPAVLPAHGGMSTVAVKRTPPSKDLVNLAMLALEVLCVHVHPNDPVSFNVLSAICSRADVRGGPTLANALVGLHMTVISMVCPSQSAVPFSSLLVSNSASSSSSPTRAPGFQEQLEALVPLLESILFVCTAVPSLSRDHVFVRTLLTTFITAKVPTGVNLREIPFEEEALLLRLLTPTLHLVADSIHHSDHDECLVVLNRFSLCDYVLEAIVWVAARFDAPESANDTRNRVVKESTAALQKFLDQAKRFSEARVLGESAGAGPKSVNPSFVELSLPAPNPFEFVSEGTPPTLAGTPPQHRGSPSPKNISFFQCPNNPLFDTPTGSAEGSPPTVGETDVTTQVAPEVRNFYLALRHLFDVMLVARTRIAESVAHSVWMTHRNVQVGPDRFSEDGGSTTPSTAGWITIDSPSNTNTSFTSSGGHTGGSPTPTGASSTRSRGRASTSASNKKKQEYQGEIAKHLLLQKIGRLLVEPYFISEANVKHRKSEDRNVSQQSLFHHFFLSMLVHLVSNPTGVRRDASAGSSSAATRKPDLQQAKEQWLKELLLRPRDNLYAILLLSRNYPILYQCPSLHYGIIFFLYRVVVDVHGADNKDDVRHLLQSIVTPPPNALSGWQCDDETIIPPFCSIILEGLERNEKTTVSALAEDGVSNLCLAVVKGVDSKLRETIRSDENQHQDVPTTASNKNDNTTDCLDRATFWAARTLETVLLHREVQISALEKLDLLLSLLGPRFQKGLWPIVERILIRLLQFEFTPEQHLSAMETLISQMWNELDTSCCGYAMLQRSEEETKPEYYEAKFFLLLRCFRSAFRSLADYPPYRLRRLQHLLCSDERFLRLANIAQQKWLCTSKLYAQREILSMLMWMIRRNPFQGQSLQESVSGQHLVELFLPPVAAAGLEDSQVLGSSVSATNVKVLVRFLVALAVENDTAQCWMLPCEEEEAEANEEDGDTKRRPAAVLSLEASLSRTTSSFFLPAAMVGSRPADIHHGSILTGLLIHLSEPEETSAGAEGSAAGMVLSPYAPQRQQFSGGDSVTSPPGSPIPTCPASPVPPSPSVPAPTAKELPSLSIECLQELLPQLAALLSRTQSLVAASQAHLLDALIELLERLLPDDVLQMVSDLIQQLACHDVSVRQLKKLLGVLTHSSLEDRARLHPVISTLLSRGMARLGQARYLADSDPSQYLMFKRGNGSSGVKINLSETFGENGYTFYLWMRTEDVAGTACILSAHNQVKTVFELVLHKGKFIIRTPDPAAASGGAKRLMEEHLDVEAMPNKWHNVVITHRASTILSKAQLSFYLDGKLCRTTGKPSFPSFGQGTIYLGTNYEMTALGRHLRYNFHGLVNAIAVLNTDLPEAVVRKLYARGGNSTYLFMVETPQSISETPLQDHVVVLVDPRLSDGSALYNMSDVLKGRLVKDSYVQALEGTTTVNRLPLNDAVLCLGGLHAVALPLLFFCVNPELPFGQTLSLPMQSRRRKRASENVAISLAGGRPPVVETLERALQLLLSVLFASPAMMAAEIEERGVFHLMHEVLRKLGSQLTPSIPVLLKDFALRLWSVRHCRSLFGPAVNIFFLSRALWADCSCDVWQCVVDCVAQIINTGDAFERVLRPEYPVTRFWAMEMIQKYNEASTEHVVLRQKVRTLLELTTNNPSEDDANALLELVAALPSVKEHSVQAEVLTLVHHLIASRSSILETLGSKGYLALLLPLLSHEDLSVRVESIHHLGILMQHSKTAQVELACDLTTNKGLSFQSNSPIVRHSSGGDESSSSPKTSMANVAASSSTQLLALTKMRDPMADVTLTFLYDKLFMYPLDVATYVALCDCMVGTHTPGAPSPSTPPPRSPNDRLVLPNFLVPILQLGREAPLERKDHMLEDLFCLLQADNMAWFKFMSLCGWQWHLLNMVLEGPHSQAMERQCVRVVSGILFSAVRQGALCAADELHLTLSFLQRARANDPRVNGTIRYLLEDLVTRFATTYNDDPHYQLSDNEFYCVRCLIHCVEDELFYSRTLAEVQPVARSGPGAENRDRCGSGVSSPVVGGQQRSSSARGQQRMRTISMKDGTATEFEYISEKQYDETQELWLASEARERGEPTTFHLCVGGERSPDSSPRSSFSSNAMGTPSKTTHVRTPSDASLGASKESNPSFSPELIWEHLSLAILTLKLLSGSSLLLREAAIHQSKAHASNATTLGISSDASVRPRVRGLQRIWLRMLRTTLKYATFQDDIRKVLESVGEFHATVSRAGKGTSSTFGFTKSKTLPIYGDTAIATVSQLHELLIAKMRAANIHRGTHPRDLMRNSNRVSCEEVLIKLLFVTFTHQHTFEEKKLLKRRESSSSSSSGKAGQRTGGARRPLSQLGTLDWLASGECDLLSYLEIGERNDYRSLLSVGEALENETHKIEGSLAEEVSMQSINTDRRRTMVMLAISQQREFVGTKVTDIEISLPESTVPPTSAVQLEKSWKKFCGRSKATIWATDNSGDSGPRYWKQIRAEQQKLVRRYIKVDSNGTDHSDITSKEVEDRASPLRGPKIRRTIPAGTEEAEDFTQEFDEPEDADDENEGEEPEQEEDDDEEEERDDAQEEEERLAEELNVAQRRHRDYHLHPQIKDMRCEVVYAMHCWIATCSLISGVFSLNIDEKNQEEAYNQKVAEAAKRFQKVPKSQSWRAAEICELAPKRRYRMRRTALEIRFLDKTCIMLNFDNEITLRTLRRALVAAKGGKEHVLVRRSNPRTALNTKNWTERWRKGEVSNFDYLLALNYFASRSLIDVTQYPIFPWVLADYESDELDWNNPQTYRNLSDPIGLAGGKHEEVAMRFNDMAEMGDEPFHYFTHYSSAAVGLHFLVRIEPFTTFQILLQGGHFDHADRMYHSVGTSWRGVCTNMQDVKELLPECFYLPEALVNLNHVHFGRRQGGELMDDVNLPPWAKGDPYRFVWTMREALEGDYVSMNLHHWIDLMFGCKQRGKEAVTAMNLYHPHTYESLKKTTVTREVIDTLDNVGQTPIQLFNKKHPERLQSNQVNPLAVVSNFGIRRTNAGRPVLPGNSAIANMRIVQNRLVVLGTNGSAAVLRINLTPVLVVSEERTTAVASTKKVFTSTSETLLTRLMNYSFSFELSPPEKGTSPLARGLIPSSNDKGEFATRTNTAIFALGERIFAVYVGLYDNSFLVRELGTGRHVTRLTVHRGKVTLVAAAQDGSHLVTGSADTSFSVCSCVRRKNDRVDIDYKFSICGHEDEPSALALSTTLDCVATASKDGTMLLHTLSRGSYLHKAIHPKNESIDNILILSKSYLPTILVCSNADNVIHQYSINAMHLRSYSLTGRLVHWSPSADPRYFFLLVSHAAEQKALRWHSAFDLEPKGRCIMEPSEPQEPENEEVPYPQFTAVHDPSKQVVVTAMSNGTLLCLGAERAEADENAQKDGDDE